MSNQLKITYTYYISGFHFYMKVSPNSKCFSPKKTLNITLVFIFYTIIFLTDKRIDIKKLI